MVMRFAKVTSTVGFLILICAGMQATSARAAYAVVLSDEATA